MSESNDIEAQTRTLLEDHRAHLLTDTTEAVEHYLAHGEPEMALEGLLIDLLDADPPGVDWFNCRVLAKQAGLHEAAVFDATIWQRLQERG